jgi:hypothetical protein
MFDSTKKKSAPIRDDMVQRRDEMVQRAAQSAAQGVEKLAVGTQKAADSVRAWADEMDRPNRSRGRIYAGLGIVAVFMALAAYLMTSKGEEHREQLQDLSAEVVNKVAS